MRVEASRTHAVGDTTLDSGDVARRLVLTPSSPCDCVNQGQSMRRRQTISSAQVSRSVRSVDSLPVEATSREIKTAHLRRQGTFLSLKHFVSIQRPRGRFHTCRTMNSSKSQVARQKMCTGAALRIRPSMARRREVTQEHA